MHYFLLSLLLLITPVQAQENPETTNYFKGYFCLSKESALSFIDKLANRIVDAEAAALVNTEQQKEMCSYYIDFKGTISEREVVLSSDLLFSLQKTLNLDGNELWGVEAFGIVEEESEEKK